MGLVNPQTSLGGTIISGNNRMNIMNIPAILLWLFTHKTMFEYILGWHIFSSKRLENRWKSACHSENIGCEFRLSTWILGGRQQYCTGTKTAFAGLGASGVHVRPWSLGACFGRPSKHIWWLEIYWNLLTYSINQELCCFNSSGRWFLSRFQRHLKHVNLCLSNMMMFPCVEGSLIKSG